MAQAVKYYNDGTHFRLPAKGRAARWIARAAENEGYRLGAVNFIFCSPERHLEINRRFLGHDYATDVITFDYGDIGRREKGKAEPTPDPRTKTVSGDVFIDPETVADNAKAMCVGAETEMRRVMVHGVLHLCGYGDKTPREQKQMRALEDFYLARYHEEV